MTSRELSAAVDRMSPDDRALLRAIAYSNSPTKAREARNLVEIFHYFPGTEGEGQISTERVVQDLPHLDPPSFLRAEVQREWEAFV